MFLPILLSVVFSAMPARGDQLASVPISSSLTSERIAALPEAQRAKWREYIQRSQALQRTDQSTLAAEVRAAGLKKPLPAPSGPVFKNTADAADGWHSGPEARRLAEAIVSFQTPSGLWSKAIDFGKGPRQEGMSWASHSDGWSYIGTFDNRATTEQLMFLAQVHRATGEAKYAAAFLKGLDAIFNAQFPSGGWPQVYPLVGDYHDAITHNDNAMIHVLQLLRAVAANKPEYAFVDDARRAKANAAIEAGVQNLLQSQIIQNGRRTAWCAQHDPLTLAPAGGRRYEPASLSGDESLEIVRFLMGIEKPGANVIAAIEGAAAWFQAAKITGIAVVSQPAADGKGREIVVVSDASAPPLWARFYELGTNRPIFLGRDAVVKYRLADIEAERRAGYAWYVSKPKALLEKELPPWRARVLASGVLSKKNIVKTITVAPDGTGDYRTPQEAVDAVPAPNRERVVIFIRPGIYKAHLVVPKDKPLLTFRGEDAATTILTNDLHVKSPGADGKEVGTIGSASTVISSDDFQAENITFENTAPHVAQALAIYIQSDRAIFRHCRFVGWQDTIRVRRGRQYFENCTISGRTDFIYGEATAWFEKCRIHLTESGGWITAANTPQDQPYGLIFSNCIITAEPGVTGKFGRPWRPYAHTVWLNTRIKNVIVPEGWDNWRNPENEKTARYAEFNSRTPDGSPVDVSKRVTWAKQLTAEEAAQYTISSVLKGDDNWNPVSSSGPAVQR